MSMYSQQQNNTLMSQRFLLLNLLEKKWENVSMIVEDPLENKLKLYKLSKEEYVPMEDQLII